MRAHRPHPFKLPPRAASHACWAAAGRARTQALRAGPAKRTRSPASVLWLRPAALRAHRGRAGRRASAVPAAETRPASGPRPRRRRRRGARAVRATPGGSRGSDVLPAQGDAARARSRPAVAGSRAPHPPPPGRSSQSPRRRETRSRGSRSSSLRVWHPAAFERRGLAHLRPGDAVARDEALVGGPILDRAGQDRRALGREWVEVGLDQARIGLGVGVDEQQPLTACIRGSAVASKRWGPHGVLAVVDDDQLVAVSISKARESRAQRLQLGVGPEERDDHRDARARPSRRARAPATLRAAARALRASARIRCSCG